MTLIVNVFIKIELSKAEFKILIFLIDNSGIAFDRVKIYRINNDDFVSNNEIFNKTASNNISVKVSRINDKIGYKIIKSRTGFGYYVDK